MWACVHVGVAMGGCEQLVARHCLALRLVGLGMASFRDESQIFGRTNWDLVGKHAEERRLTKLWRVGALRRELILPSTPFLSVTPSKDEG